MTAKKEEGWERQDRVDSELASDMSRDKNMLDFCDYFETGKAYITLAGFMKIANEEKFTSEIHDIIIDTHKIHAIVKVTNSDGDSMFSGRTEYHIGRDGKPDQHALAKAINIATKNGVKQLLYGHAKVETMLTDFERDVEFEPSPKTTNQQNTPESNPDQTPNANGKKPEPQQTKTEQETKKQTKTPKEQATTWYESRFAELSEINIHENTETKDVLANWCLYFLIKTTDKMTDREYLRVVKELKKEDMGLIGNFFRKKPADMQDVMDSHRTMLEGGGKNASQADEAQKEPAF